MQFLESREWFISTYIYMNMHMYMFTVGLLVWRGAGTHIFLILEWDIEGSSR